jgi:hypothetical protein
MFKNYFNKVIYQKGGDDLELEIEGPDNLNNNLNNDVLGETPSSFEKYRKEAEIIAGHVALNPDILKSKEKEKFKNKYLKYKYKYLKLKKLIDGEF